MILQQDWDDYRKMADLGVLNNPALVLGNQSVKGMDKATDEAFADLGITEYDSLDPDGGTLPYDLNEPISDLANKYATVLNIGTIEHVWDAHTAWVTALHAVAVGGHLVTVTPIEKWEGHGIHVTDAYAIMGLLKRNGFTIKEAWAVRYPRGTNLWLAAHKNRHIKHRSDYQKPQQQYINGKKARAA